MELTNYQIILLFAVGGFVAIMGSLVTSWVLRPRRPNEEKLTTYECGEDPTGTAWGKFNIRFYVIALVFVLFETELLFLFPWAIVFGDEGLNALTQGKWGMLAFVEMSLFILILALGLAYVWGKGFLEWEKPDVKVTDVESKVPESLYDQLNTKYQ
ncbi:MULTISPECIES: NADH-quinone oxidoreductase subunit A [Reichenbachiella]|uniref:NADH-quinone oxidoreductase subunit A n=1 Tax=Reichenbachiella TaxID=156993 RepID=UPI000C1484D2|nr:MULTISPECIES: NADH-quinone oxidoreductase subunit A [Reichenbachiella]MBU2914571.1 NADH-quinone oxidoreductase subunit A [Reichenbachiella agariperforans]PIB36464.1 NADH dehydrogenase [Reichenbachiella sp. 5M10]RJE70594.1 NADH dehydrogenase [Reichenbachiella sp. MSK19-1]